MSVVPEHRPLSPRLARKARARYEQGRVQLLPNIVTYGVRGDTEGSLYKVDVEPINGTDHMTCDCPANGQCWHIQAVRIARRDETDAAEEISAARALNLETGATP
jgi:uncharacterized Zn finger protein